MRPAESPKPPPEGRPLGLPICYGHPRRVATKCGHDIHPSSSIHTPWCPACVASLTRAKLDAAQKNLVTQGGLTPVEYMRDRQWIQARLKHEIAKQRLEKKRKENQLRWEREQLWDELHKQYDSQRPLPATGLQDPSPCPACASLVNSYPVQVPEAHIARNVTWWERPGALAVDHISLRRTPPRSRKQPQVHAPKAPGSQALRKAIQDRREAMHAAETYRRMWEIRNKTESAVRRKHSLGEGFYADPDFWDLPISGLVSLQNFQHNQNNQRLAARRARGNAPRPRPPRSSLSFSETPDEVIVDQNWIEKMREEEEREGLEKETRKVGREVGYLYFVGAIDGMEEWREDYLRSNRQLVTRTLIANSETSGSEDSGDSCDEDGFDDIDPMVIDEPK
ncbi:hypothetical protein BKA66DRAFT_415529 [Pyrenochaeta sp. MPI-SDFR-AT-0127]|nr:hypothetical protein BKA66DRAFT_415529 [Pyrenochaeta sp. MPI-SDFR-AT-0127]